VAEIPNPLKIPAQNVQKRLKSHMGGLIRGCYRNPGTVIPSESCPPWPKTPARKKSPFKILKMGNFGHFWTKNSNSRKNLGPGTKSDFIFELSVVDLGGTPYLLGFYSAFLKSDL